MSVLRFFSTLCVLVAVIALVSDLTPTWAGQQSLALSSIETHWKQVAPATYESLAASDGEGAMAWVWAYGIRPLLRVPTCVAFALLALLTGYIGRRRTRVKIYAN